MGVRAGSVLCILVVGACAKLPVAGVALADSSPLGSLTATFHPRRLRLWIEYAHLHVDRAWQFGDQRCCGECLRADGIGLTPVSESECDGTLSVSENAYLNSLLIDGPTYSVRLTGASLAPGSSCQFALPVVGDAAGTTQLELDGAPYLMTTNGDATLMITPSARPAVITASFARPQIDVGQTTDLTITVENPNPTTILTTLRVQALATSVAGAIAPETVISNGCGGQVGFENVSPSVGAAPGLYLAPGLTASGSIVHDRRERHW